MRLAMNAPTRKTIFRALLHLVLAAANVYGLMVSALLLLRILFGERWSFMGLFDSFAHLLMMPALPLIVVLLVMRRRTALLQGIPAMAFLLSYGVFFLPHTVQAAPDTPEIRIVTYNLNKSNQALDAVEANLRALNADMVAFQELNPVLAAGLQDRLSDLYPYAALHPDLADGFAGLGILSRYPILADTYWPIGLGHQRVEVDVNGVRIAVHNTHPTHPLRGLGYDGTGRAAAISAALDKTAADDEPLLLVGDFNMTDQTGDYQRVTSVYHDSWHEVGQGMGFTFPDFKVLPFLKFLPPLARIDYVFHNSDFEALQIQVGGSSGGSDHRPVYAVLALNPTGTSP
jgi:vancomycin resistance protein VanJ